MSEIDRRNMILGGAVGTASLVATTVKASEPSALVYPYITTWEPIETAPKDGTKIILYIPPSNNHKKYFIRTGYWEDTEEYIPAGHRYYRYGKLIEEEGEKLHTIKKWYVDLFGHNTQPTHWMPMPNPPEVKGITS